MGLFKKSVPNSIRAIDMHCHILPGVDDGSSSIEESIQMGKLAYENGIDTIICTPHYKQFLEAGC